MCNLCDIIFKRKDNLVRHNKIKHVVDDELDYMEPIECDICEEIFSRKDNLIRHKQINHQCQGSSKFECNECGKQFSRRDALHRHKNVHQSVPNTIFSCGLCDTKFTEKNNFQRHQKGIYFEDGTRRNKCSECSDSFCNSKMLRSHINLKHRSFMRDECGQSCTLKNSLELHVKTRSFVPCSDCGKTLCNLKSVCKHYFEYHRPELAINTS